MKVAKPVSSVAFEIGKNVATRQIPSVVLLFFLRSVSGRNVFSTEARALGSRVNVRIWAVGADGFNAACALEWDQRHGELQREVELMRRCGAMWPRWLSSLSGRFVGDLQRRARCRKQTNKHWRLFLGERWQLQGKYDKISGCLFGKRRPWFCRKPEINKLSKPIR